MSSRRNACYTGPLVCASGVAACTPPVPSGGSPTPCNEAEDRCEVGIECTTDADCDDGILCDGIDYCSRGFCGSVPAFDLFRSETVNAPGPLAEFLLDCTSAGYARVRHLSFLINGTTLEWTCTCLETMVSSHQICDFERQGCDAVCTQAGWDESLDPVNPFCHGDLATMACTCGMLP